MSPQAQTDWATQYGPIFSVDIPGIGPIVVVSEPGIQRDITSQAGFGREAVKAECVGAAFGTGILSTIGEEWSWRRKAVVREYSTARLMSPKAGLLEAMVHECEAVCSELDRAADAGDTVDVEELTMKFGVSMVLFHLFGRTVHCDTSLFRPSEASLWKAYGAYLNARFQGVDMEPEQSQSLRQLTEAAHAVFDDVARPELQALLEEFEAGMAGDPDRNECVVASLLRSEPRFASCGIESLLEDVRTIMVAGFGTTSTQLALTLGMLADPENVAVAEQAGREAVAAMDAGLDRDTFQERTSYLNNVFCEALRLRPIVASSNGCARSDIHVQVEDVAYTIPSGSGILFANEPGQRCPRTWSEPGRFDPDRWAKPGRQKDMMAFGKGPHECAGRNMAFMEARVFLTVVLSRFRFELPPGAEHFEWRQEMVVRPKHHLRVFRS